MAEVIYLPGAESPASGGGAALPAKSSEGNGEVEDFFEVADAVDPVEVRPIREISLKVLSRRDHSRKELRELLAEFQELEIEQELADLERLGYLDDQRLADSIVERLVQRKGLGSSAIRMELQKRKLDSEAVSGALEAVDKESERDRAVEFLQKRAARMDLTDREGAIRRLSGQLARRGFDADTIRSAISQVLRS
ncbi:MAG: regulatory protein RecX [Cryobacterium sp.]|nr:regulatory protein RecX [Cryobacterium sp.]MCO5294147.1 recombination regulator RecX [Homoserinimonas sp.]